MNVSDLCANPITWWYQQLISSERRSSRFWRRGFIVSWFLGWIEDLLSGFYKLLYLKWKNSQSSLYLIQVLLNEGSFLNFHRNCTIIEEEFNFSHSISECNATAIKINFSDEKLFQKTYFDVKMIFWIKFWN